LIFTKKLKFNKKIFLKRTNKQNEWKEVEEKDILNTKYGKPFKSANALLLE